MPVTLKLPVTINATYEIVTPMFIGDALQQASAVFPQSFKGALRFWWRALNWSVVRQGCSNDNEALVRLHEKEAMLFGSTDNGQGKCAVKVKMIQSDRISSNVCDWPPNNPNNGSSYLAYGITESGNGDTYQPHRDALPEGARFRVELILTEDMTEEQKSELIIVLELIGLFGGLGSRTRRGLGSVQLEELNTVPCRIENPAAYQEKVNTLLKVGNSNVPLPPYTAFSKETSFKNSKTVFANARLAHKHLGQIYRNYRGQPSNLRGSVKKVFGLPLKGIDETARRASPLLFHIISFSDGTFGYSVLYLPSSIFHKQTQHQRVDTNLIDQFMKLI